MLPKVELVRIMKRSNCTFGVLIFGITPLCYTLEPPWRFNQTNRSCIPSGEYRLTHNEATHRIEITDVPGRSGVLIHAGNTVGDSKGCILPGLEFEFREGVADPYISRSRDAMRLLEKIIHGRDHIIEVSGCCTGG